MMNLRGLPKIRDSLSYLYVEHCFIEKDNSALKLIDASGVVPIPVASLSVLMLGPGTKITHDAVTIAVQNGCSLVWTGEEGVRTYAAGTGETRSSTRLLHQIHQWANEERRLQIVIKMYQFRFPDPIEKGFTLQQIRGKEGARVR
ncbi:partial CRISPR-associated endonuclease Cas1, partial [uncultured bacterium]